MTYRRSLAAILFLVCVQTAATAQTLGEVSRRIEAARKTTDPAVVYDERDMSPALARRELLLLRIDAAAWQRFLRADRQVGAAAAADPDFLQRLEGLNYVTVRSLGRFFARERAVAAQLESAGMTPQEYADLYLATKLALSDHPDALADVPQQNSSFLKARAREVSALTIPLDSVSLHTLRSAAPGTPALSAGPSPRSSASPSGVTAAPRPARNVADAGGAIDMSLGAEIPDFDFIDFQGRRRQLSDFRGKYLMLDFWGSWCPPCREEIPYVKDAYTRFGSRGFEVLGMDSERTATIDHVREYLTRNGVQWTFATPDSVRSIINDRFQITSFPTVILLGPDGRVIEARSSALRGQRLAKTLDRLLPK